MFFREKWIAIALVATLGAGASMAPIACAQIIGSDKDRILAGDAAAPTTASTSAPTNTVPPCASNQKRCSGACISIDDPAYGCSPTGCTPCDIPYAASEKCAAGACGVATCQAGRADCNGQASDGCEADLGSAPTCGSCTTACGGAVAPYCTPSGQCVDSCGALTLCDNSSCRQLGNNADNCGTCGHVCPNEAHSVGACNDSQCGIACNAGWGDCNSDQNDGCEAPLMAYYVDADDDGYGASGSPALGTGCVPPKGDALNASDCLDTGALAASVHPGQPDYFGSSYTTPSGSPSFDYDCDGAETVAAGITVGGTCTPCTAGFIPVAGAKYANPYCGSSTATSCNLATSPVCSTNTGSTAVGCH